MHRRTARGNRRGLALVGILLLLAGAALLVANRGYWPGDGEQVARDVLYPPAARRFVHDHGTWLWPLVAAAAIAAGVLFLRWLLVQPRIDRVRRLVVDSDEYADEDETAGRTRMPARAILDVVEDDITALHGVRRASAVLSGHADAPELWLTVGTSADADVARIRREVTGRVVADARTCLDLPELPTYLTLDVTRRAGRRDLR